MGRIKGKPHYNYRPIADRIAAKITKERGHHLWTGSMSHHEPIIAEGKGSVKRLKVREVLWRGAVVNDDERVIATCPIARCVRPEHLNKVARGAVLD